MRDGRWLLRACKIARVVRGTLVYSQRPGTTILSCTWYPAVASIEFASHELRVARWLTCVTGKSD